MIPGQVAELRAAPTLLLIAAHLGHLGHMVCDGAYASTPWLPLIEEEGAQPVMRAVAARYDRTATRFNDGRYLAATLSGWPTGLIAAATRP